TGMDGRPAHGVGGHVRVVTALRGLRVRLGHGVQRVHDVGTRRCRSVDLRFTHGSHVLVEELLIVLLPLFVADFCWAPGGRRPAVVLPAVVGLVVLVALTVSYLLWWLPVATAAVFGLFVVIHSLPRRFPLRRVLAMTLRRVGVVSGVGVL